MRKFLLVLIATILILLTGCEYSDEESNVPVNLKEITGDVTKATLDSNGDIIINKSEVTNVVRYYSYEFEGVTIGLLAVRDSNDNVKVVINTCSSCMGSPYAYFVQVGDKIQCQNCGSLFDIDSLDEVNENGCNPINIENKEETDELITISHAELEQYKEKFENWQGPKV